MLINDQLVQIFEPRLLEDFEHKCSTISVKEGDTILDIGQTVRTIPLVLSGTLKISRIDEDGNEILLYYISPNESCAMSFTCCMQEVTSEVKLTAEEDSIYLAVPIAAMDEWMMKYPSWKSFLMKTIRARFNELLKSIDQLAFQKLDERLIYYLKEKSRATGSSLINISHEQIANEMASSREVISRLLKRLENEKKLLLYRNQIKLLKEL